VKIRYRSERPTFHREWLVTLPRKRSQDFSSQDFSSQDFSSQDFSSQDFSYQDFSYQDFSYQIRIRSFAGLNSTSPSLTWKAS
jgi:uncharacterized protein YjbI with pentapeptide repeats